MWILMMILLFIGGLIFGSLISFLVLHLFMAYMDEV